MYGNFNDLVSHLGKHSSILKSIKYNFTNKWLIEIKDNRNYNFSIKVTLKGFNVVFDWCVKGIRV